MVCIHCHILYRCQLSRPFVFDDSGAPHSINEVLPLLQIRYMHLCQSSGHEHAVLGVFDGLKDLAFFV